MKRYAEELKWIVKSKTFLLCSTVIALLCFGYAMVNTSVSIDDMEYDRYVGSGNVMLAAGRFGIWLWSFLEGTWENSYLIDILAIAMLLFACMNFAILFRRVSNNKIEIGALTVFSCMLISYPLVIEIWEYTGANVNICGSYLLVSFALLLIPSFINSEKKLPSYTKLCIATILMTLVAAGYESLVSVYIFLVFAMLYIESIYQDAKPTLLSHIKSGSVYATVLAVGIVLRLIIHRIILVVLSLSPEVNGATKIAWGTKPFSEIVKNLFSSWVVKYGFRSLIYFPLGVLMVCGIIYLIFGIHALKKRGAVMLVSIFGMLLSLIILSLVQGSFSPYRTCQVFAVFCAFTLMILVNQLKKGESKQKNAMRICSLVLCGLLCFYQASYVNHFLELNHRRSESEAQVIYQINYDLKHNYSSKKPVLFVGTFDLDKGIVEEASVPKDSKSWKLYKKLATKYYNITNQPQKAKKLSRKLPVNNINSVISWSVTAFEQESMPKLFAYYGCSYVPADYSLYKSSKQIAKEMPAYPKNGYIKDVGDYIIVHL